jgi:hypothetical protein
MYKHPDSGSSGTINIKSAPVEKSSRRAILASARLANPTMASSPSSCSNPKSRKRRTESILTASKVDIFPFVVCITSAGSRWKATQGNRCEISRMVRKKVCNRRAVQRHRSFWRFVELPMRNLQLPCRRVHPEAESLMAIAVRAASVGTSDCTGCYAHANLARPASARVCAKHLSE